MIQEVIVPKLGTNIEEGVIAEWRRREGEHVKKGDVLLLVETSKAVFEVESEFNGFLRKIFFGAGSGVRLTQPVAILTESEGEEIKGYLEEAAVKRDAPGEKRHHERKREELVKGGRETGRPAPRKPAPLLIQATPAARRLMAEHRIAPEKMAGSFRGEPIDESAVRSFLKRKKTAVYGGGLGAKQVRELLRFYEDEITAVGIIDDNPQLKGKEILGLEVLGGWDDFVRLASTGVIDSAVVSLHSEARRKIIERLRREAPQVHLIPLVDRRAIVAGGVSVSPGAFVEAGAVIGPDTFIGEGVIVDTGAVVSHDCHIGAHSHLSPGSAISGIVRLEWNVLVGVGASVNSQVTVGRNSVITPGSAVVSDIPPDVVVTGNPARVIGKSLRGA